MMGEYRKEGQRRAAYGAPLIHDLLPSFPGKSSLAQVRKFMAPLPKPSIIFTVK